MAARYLGLWHLIPELSIYEQGEPPVSGTYHITESDGVVAFSIDWTAPGGTPNSMAFSGPLDGAKHPADLPGLSHVSYTHIDEWTLDSAAFADDRQMMHARRRASKDGTLLAVVQRIRIPDGAMISNMQVYRRA